MKLGSKFNVLPPGIYILGISQSVHKYPLLVHVEFLREIRLQLLVTEILFCVLYNRLYSYSTKVIQIRYSPWTKVLKNNINNSSLLLQYPSFPDLTQIKEMREALGISLPKLEKHTGVKRSLLRKLESGETSTSYKNATAIFSYLVNSVNVTKKTVGVFSNHNIVSITPDETVEKARTIMTEGKYDVLPIITKSGILRGQISIFKLNPKKIKNENEIIVDEVSEEAPVSVPHYIPVHWIRIFLQEPGTCIMITKSGKYVGIINLHHLITHL